MLPFAIRAASFVGKNWTALAVAGAVAATFLTIVSMRSQIDQLKSDVEAADLRTAIANTAAATERANADELAGLLQQALDNAEADRLAREEAEQERDEALLASQQRGDDLRETIIVERQADATLDQCLRLDLPDSVVRNLPFRTTTP